MTRTIIAVVTLSEPGDITSITWIDPSTYVTVHEARVNLVGGEFADAPSLSSGFYDSGEHFRSDLGAYVTQGCQPVFGLANAHGDRLVWVDDACSTYVYEIDFDGVSLSKARPAPEKRG